jgi:hypothetical protein
MWQLLTISPGNMANFAKTNPKKTYVAFAFLFYRKLPQCKIHQKQTIDHDPPKLSSTQLHFWYHQKPSNETGYTVVISQFLNQQSKSYSI